MREEKIRPNKSSLGKEKNEEEEEKKNSNIDAFFSTQLISIYKKKTFNTNKSNKFDWFINKIK
jgi:hypothetical protein